ncbi:MAG TPA: GIY-YIG nuclease family protein [Chitinophaga sp.]|uniref:GIY-YIG nuclease family protein n=1 Tax=Chitinophaga sp. TaxID=1869181 RepID=UPI002DBF5853|nr:GIY-YIG nuclease family protein [Chitinophaga sp.]HEU4554996.1 GIY-YIG nuclease family protein [Chitinophaga sp.]
MQDSYEDILKNLNSSKTSHVFNGLCQLKETNIDDNAFPHLKRIAETATTFKNKKLAFAIITRYFPNKLEGLNFRTDNNLGYIYFIRETLFGHVKIGRSRNLEKRLRIFAADLPFETQLLRYIKTYNYEKIELELHKIFSQKRVKGEWFRLEDEDIDRINNNNFPDAILTLIKNDC